MILTMIVSFTGIGNTTSDLTRNSEPEEVVCINVDAELGSVEAIEGIINTPGHVDRFVDLEDHIQKSHGVGVIAMACMQLGFTCVTEYGPIEEGKIFELTACNLEYIPPLIQCRDVILNSYKSSIPLNGKSKFHNRKYNTNYNYDRYRRARDGLRQPRS